MSKRQLAAIMFTDIVGYTALMGRNEQKAMDLLKTNREIHKKYLKEFGGKWLKEMGDGILASFTTISDAVYCAGAIQQAAGDHPDLDIRIGIHVGEVVIENDDVFGDGVNIASRIEALATPGEIWVSESVYKNIKNKEGIELSFIRDETLKNVDEPVKIFSVDVKKRSANQVEVERKPNRILKPAIIVIGTLILLLLAINILYFNPSGQSNAASAEKSIAILPFKNMSNEGDKQYYADGIMEAILNDLSGIGELTVIPGTSVEQYRSTTKTAPQIGNELDVSYLLTGSAQLYGEKVRITVKLIDAQKDTQIWSENYDRELSDIFVTQSEIAERVGTALEAKLTLREKEILQSAPTNDLEAYDLYLRGKEYAKRYLNKLEYTDYKNASDLYKKALESDPDFALAYVGLAEIYFERNFLREYLDEQPLDSMLLLCNQALAKDENLEEAYTLRGQFYYWIQNSAEKAKENFNKALTINPNYIPAMFELADLYGWENNFTESFKILINSARLVKGADLTELYSNIAGIYLHIGEYEKAEYYVNEVLKLEPDNVGAYGFLAHINRCQGNFDKNLPIADILLRINPEGRALYDLAIINMMNGRYEESEKYFRQLYSSSPDIISMSGYGDKHMYSYVLMKNGKEEEARQNLAEVRDFMLDVISRERQWTKDLGYELAKVYALLGDKEEALKWFDLYNKNGMSAGLHDFALYDPPLESLRDDPRFLEIINEARIQVEENRIKINNLEASLEMDQWLGK